MFHSIANANDIGKCFWIFKNFDFYNTYLVIIIIIIIITILLITTMIKTSLRLDLFIFFD